MYDQPMRILLTLLLSLLQPVCDDACEPGQAGCQCEVTGACAEGLTCDDDICKPCEPGLEGCPCEVTGRCSGELVCTDGLCQ
jgi:hypothetical protein